MRLSTRCRYGIHAMYDLAQNVGAGPQTIRSIAERQLVPEQYLEQIIGVLRREGLVKSLRGAQGGYMLARAPDEISIGELIRLLEGPVKMADCTGDADACIRSGQCPSRLVWERLTNTINGVIDSITLQDMLEDHVRLLDGEETGHDG
ncbi:Rrf2 family transcriptional regulator [Eubacteriales bacterium OttesenSCG-928-A19]|nr:Rrf2 family transcriptional regulator [Eubacteriales bacterium OttesenSCG-928-A19]